MAEPLVTMVPDECCCKRLVRQLGKGQQGQRWTCPKCGTEWKAEVYQLDNGEGITHWAPVAMIELL